MSDTTSIVPISFVTSRAAARELVDKHGIDKAKIVAGNHATLFGQLGDEDSATFWRAVVTRLASFHMRPEPTRCDH